MAIRSSILIVALVILAFLASAVVIRMQPGQVDSIECAPISIVIDKANSVHGLKNDNLFAYVDLTEMAPSLSCHSDAEIQDALATVVAQSVTEWWKEPRLASATKAEVHIISILDKDEYARANFNSALTHGKMEFRRDGEQVTALPATLTFDNMRSKLGQ